MKRSIQHCLFLIKVSTISVSGMVIVKPEDCEAMQSLIISRTGLFISLVALKRIFGFEPAKFPPSLHTLDVLSQYCSYDNWDSYCEEQKKEENLSHKPL